MNLTDAQKQTVARWIHEGLKLAEIQKRLGTELGLHLTYMDARLLVDDLKLTPKDPERPKPVEPAATSLLAPKPGGAPTPTAAPSAVPTPGSGVSVSVDQIARPGSVTSGSVKFSDGETATWQMDQYGRLGLGPKKQGYKPTQADVQSFQLALEAELTKLGL
jgi:hypothetical protein